MRYLTLLVLLLSFIAPMSQSFAVVPEEATFGLKQDSTEWKRLEMEEWLVFKLSEELARFVPREHFTVYADVTFKAPGRRVVSVTKVNLSKFGQVATVVRGERVRPELGAFDKVSKLQLTLVVSKEVDQSTVKAMVDILKARVPVIDRERIFAKTYRMKAPPQNLQAWIRELKPFLMLALGLALGGYLLLLILQRVRISWSWNITPRPQAERARPRDHHEGVNHDGWVGHLPPATPLEALTDPVVTKSAIREDFPEGLEMGAANSLVATNDHHIRLRKLRNILLSLSVAESAAAAKADANVGAVMGLLLPPSRSREVLARLSEVDKKKVYKASLHWSEARVAQEAVGIAEQIKTFRKTQVDVTKGGHHALATYVEQIGAEGEESFYQNLIETGRCEDLAVVAHWVPPSTILEQVDDEVLFGFWTRLHLKDRMELLAYADRELADRLMQKLEHKDFAKKAHFEQRVARLRKELDPSRRSEMAYVAWNRLLAVARAAYRQSPELQEKLRGAIDSWLWNRTKGVVGVQAKKQKKSA